MSFEGVDTLNRTDVLETMIRPFVMMQLGMDDAVYDCSQPKLDQTEPSCLALKHYNSGSR